MTRATKEEEREFARLLRLVFPEEYRRKQRKWYRDNIDHCRYYHRQWTNKHADSERERRKGLYWRDVDLSREKGRNRYYRRRKKATVYRHNKLKTDINFRIADVLRQRIYSALKGKYKSRKTLELLGCSVQSFKLYLESRFEPGMAWENYGKFGWHIDHIIPIALFDLSRPEHQLACFHFSNMQPMWAKENHSKGKNIITEEHSSI